MFCLRFSFCFILLLFFLFFIATSSGNNSTCFSPSFPYQPLPDVNCHASSAEISAIHTAPLLSKIVQTKFFRYFYVDLGRACPFEGLSGGSMCNSRGCQVGTFEKGEIPWKQKSSNDDYGWIINDIKITEEEEESLSKIAVTIEDSDDFTENKKEEINETFTLFGNQLTLGDDYASYHRKQKKSSGYLGYLHYSEDCTDNNNWTEMLENNPPPTSSNSFDTGIYVDLVANPERFTGYSGEPARMIWNSIRDENCFGGENDLCLEKRVFYRLISGLQASISTHIAREYLFPENVTSSSHNEDTSSNFASLFLTNSSRWGIYPELYAKRVGIYPERVSNLYFTYLFYYRAFSKAKNLLINYSYYLGGEDEDWAERNELKKMFKQLYSLTDNASCLESLQEENTEEIKEIEGFEVNNNNEDDNNKLNIYEDLFNTRKQAALECSLGFNETNLFQVNENSLNYFKLLDEKNSLRNEFQLRFRNISRIMDCVHCEKCRLWGKVQILGLGTAIKILLTPQEELDNDFTIINRQELIAFVNSFRQITLSIVFASDYGHEASKYILQQKLEEEKLRQKEIEEMKDMDPIQEDIPIYNKIWNEF